jgi:hypothetical protein
LAACIKKAQNRHNSHNCLKWSTDLVRR